jgi:hypothetical protein
MTASRFAAVSLGPRSQFLDGLTPTDRKTILAAATQRRFFANSVITNQGHPADNLFLLTKGLVRYFFVTEAGKKQHRMRQRQNILGLRFAPKVLLSCGGGGRREAAIRVEQFGNILAETYKVDILCAYPFNLLIQEDEHAFRTICAEHSAVYSA